MNALMTNPLVMDTLNKQQVDEEEARYKKDDDNKNGEDKNEKDIISVNI